MRLTPNQRMALYLKEQGEAEVSEFQGYIHELWTGLCLQQNTLIHDSHPIRCSPAIHDTPILLNAIDQELIFEKIISEHCPQNLRPMPIAKLAASAFDLIQNWSIPFTEDLWITDDQRMFYQWACEYQALCQKNHWISNTEIYHTLMSALQHGKLDIAKSIDCVGFLEWKPLQRQFLEALQNCHLKVTESTLLNGQWMRSEFGKDRNVACVAAEDSNVELVLAAEFMQKKLSSEPNARCAVVVPDLTSRRSEVLSVFEQFFEPSLLDIAAPPALMDYPFIQSAINLLALFKQGNNLEITLEMSLEEVSYFLRSPFIGNRLSEKDLNEMAYWAEVDFLLREKAEEMMSLSHLIYLLRQIEFRLGGDRITQLIRKFETVSALLQTKSRRENPKTWGFVWQEILHLFAWPGGRTLNSLEYQLQGQWQALLNEYERFSAFFSVQSYFEGLKYLKHLACKKTFLPEVKNPKIQVLGLLEAASLPFDALWMVGLHREAWPMAAKPNPFIPISLQKKLNLPRSSAEKELKMAKTLTQQFSLSATEVVFSYPKTLEGNSLLPSRLLADIPVVSVASLGLNSLRHNHNNVTGETLLRDVCLVPKVSAMSDEWGPPLKAEIGKPGDLEKAVAAEESNFSLGGTKALKLQAACPFLAFAEIRLKAKTLPRPRFGLTSAERGEILHQILFQIWEGMPSQAALLALSEETLDSRLKSCIIKVLDQWQEQLPHTLTKQYRLIEEKRLFDLVMQVLLQEKERMPFDIVAREHCQEVTIKDLRLKLKLDRIDKLENGDEVIIDYKTGRVVLSDLFSERLKEPQLPLYCVAREKKPSAIAFALIRAEEIKFVGVAESEDLLPGVKQIEKLKRLGALDSFAEQLESWKDSLESLAEEFSQGFAKVDPVDGEATCRQCSLQSLCRVGVCGG